MTRSIFIALIVFANTAFAQNRVLPLIPEIKEPGLGTIRVVITDLEHPAWAPHQLRIQVKCEDRRTRPNAVTPDWEELIEPVSICALRPAKYSPSTKTLTLQYRTSEPAPGQAKCNKEWGQDIPLKDVCARWQPD